MATDLTLHQQHFLETIAPIIERQARVDFRHYRKNRERQEDMMQKAMGLGWKHYQRLRERGIDPEPFKTVFAQRVCQAVRDSRDVTGRERLRDAMSPVAQRAGEFAVQSIPEFDTTDKRDNETLEALADTRNASPLDQVQAVVDVKDWRKTLPHRDQKIFDDMVEGSTTTELADKYGFSQARGSQIRRKFVEAYHDFQGEGPDGQER